LHKFELAISAQIFVAETARDLQMFVQSRNHQHLFEQRRRLRRPEKLTEKGARRQSERKAGTIGAVHRLDVCADETICLMFARGDTRWRIRYFDDTALTLLPDFDFSPAVFTAMMR
jgi:hypothetical protein